MRQQKCKLVEIRSTPAHCNPVGSWCEKKRGKRKMVDTKIDTVVNDAGGLGFLGLDLGPG
jgi:hypothetical protein